MNINPTTTEIAAARKAAHLTQAAAAELLHSTRRTWQDWEYGVTPMHPAMWELFTIKLMLRGNEKNNSKSA